MSRFFSLWFEDSSGNINTHRNGSHRIIQPSVMPLKELSIMDERARFVFLAENTE
ncbi:hypothetical protein MLD52_17745 [Puniceicoccaceae bacterium K14]|nr:hypothetical protein [Puniceicoccaceae bacterium K14]